VLLLTPACLADKSSSLYRLNDNLDGWDKEFLKTPQEELAPGRPYILKLFLNFYNLLRII
jgi:hypothetical protein